MAEEAARPKILHVDDFDEFLDAFRDMFDAWLDVTSAASAQEALQLLETVPFDAVVIDYDMPEMDGIAFTEIVKERWPLTPVVFCTARGSEEVARQAFKAGATDYFLKDFTLPVDREKLVNAIRQAVERRAVEETLQRERRVLESLIDLNPYSIQIFDAGGHHVRWNDASVKLFGVAPPADGPSVFDDPNFVDSPYGELLQRVRRGQAARFPVAPYNPSSFSPTAPDMVLYTSGVAFPLLDEKGEMERMVVMHEDATARVEAEEALRRANEELQRSYELLEARVAERTAELAETNASLQREIHERERLQQELVRKNRELEAFSSRVSHDLRNELLILRRTLEAVADTPEMKARTDEILTRYDRLMAFVSRLLELARMGKVISRRVETPTEPLLADLFERLRPDGLQARLAVAEGCPPIPGDPLGLEQVFANLLVNSFRHAHPERPALIVDVDVQPQGDEVEVVYRDNGVGIRPEHIDRVFDVSFTTDRENHFGMGLAFVRRIIDAHGGRVQAVGRGGGAEFRLCLPQVRAKRAPR